jgi:hypothetical protein
MALSHENESLSKVVKIGQKSGEGVTLAQIVYHLQVLPCFRRIGLLGDLRSFPARIKAVNSDSPPNHQIANIRNE